MSILTYFKPMKSTETVNLPFSTETVNLPSQTGPLFLVMPSFHITAANKEVEKILSMNPPLIATAEPDQKRERARVRTRNFQQQISVE